MASQEYPRGEDACPDQGVGEGGGRAEGAWPPEGGAGGCGEGGYAGGCGGGCCGCGEGVGVVVAWVAGLGVGVVVGVGVWVGVGVPYRVVVAAHWVQQQGCDSLPECPSSAVAQVITLMVVAVRVTAEA